MAAVDPTAVFRAELAAERKSLRAVQSDLRRRDAEIAKLTAQLQAERDAEAERQLAAAHALKPVSIPIETHAGGAPGYPVVLWSDWHWGETVDIREMNGINAFNPEIAAARVKRLVNGTITLLREYAGTNPTYPGMWVCLGGDMISGNIHDELRDTNWTPGADQVSQVTEVLAGALERMHAEFGTLHVPCVVGNHGRVSVRPRAKSQVKENFEWIVYKSLERHFASNPAVTFYIPEGPDYHFEIYGHRFMLTHGDRLGVKGGDGIIGAVGPITRGAFKISRQQAQIGRDFDTLLMGHWHTYTPRGDANNTIVNGSLKGFDEYAMNMLRVPFSEPAQALWLVSPKHGIAAQWRVDCGNLTGVDP